MNNRNTIQEELQALGSFLPTGAPSNLYEVPEGYFENMPSVMLMKVKGLEDNAASELETLSPLLAGLSKKMPFSVPDGFFEQKEKEAFDLISEPVSGILDRISKTVPYEVPESYFESLPEIVIARVATPRAKVVPLFKRPFMKMAVAALVAGIMALGGIAYFNRPSEISVDNPQWVASKLQNVPDKALDEFVKNADLSATTSRSQARQADAGNMLHDVTDKELQAFLDQVPVEEELAIN